MAATTASPKSRTLAEIARDRRGSDRPRINLPEETPSPRVDAREAKPDPPQQQHGESSEPDRILWSRAKREQLPVEVKLQGGFTIIGQVRNYGRYSILVETADKRLIVVFKSAMATGEIVDALP